MTATKAYTFTITAPTEGDITKVLLHIIDQADKTAFDIDYHVSITDPEES